MLQELDILNGINAALCSRFPDRAVYVNAQTEDYQRPSFFIISGQKTQTAGTRRTVHRTETYSILLKELEDEAGISLLEELQRTQAQLLALFSRPVACDDRRLLPTAVGVPIEEFDAARVNLTFDFFDDLPEDFDEDPEDLMEHIIINNKEVLDGSADS